MLLFNVSHDAIICSLPCTSAFNHRVCLEDRLSLYRDIVILRLLTYTGFSCSGENNYDGTIKFLSSFVFEVCHSLELGVSQVLNHLILEHIWP